MVKLTVKYLIRNVNSRKQFLVRRKNETDKQFLNRITHLYLENQFIDQIMRMESCKNVSVIYLQNNMLRCLNNIDCFPNLTHLYLQRNFLNKIENLDCLQKLKKIYLGFNEISLVEGFARLSNVEEVHIECEYLAFGERLLFEPQTLRSFSSTLRVLNVSQNNLTTLSDLKRLLRLEILIAEDNHVGDLDDLTDTLREWPFLKSLALAGNPVTTDRRYRDNVIFASKNLEVLDDKTICSNTRKFIEKLTERRKCIETAVRCSAVEKGREKKKESKVKASDLVNDALLPLPPHSSAPRYSFPPWTLRRYPRRK